jgi:hypothetical protein
MKQQERSLKPFIVAVALPMMDPCLPRQLLLLLLLQLPARRQGVSVISLPKPNEPLPLAGGELRLVVCPAGLLRQRGHGGGGCKGAGRWAGWRWGRGLDRQVGRPVPWTCWSGQQGCSSRA